MSLRQAHSTWMTAGAHSILKYRGPTLSMLELLSKAAMVIAQSPRRIRSNTDSSLNSGTGRNPLLAPRRKINSLPVRRLSRSRRGRSSSSGGAPRSLPMGSTRLAATYDNVVIKSPNDRRSYRILNLPNGLFALLVHDPEIYSDGYPMAESETQEARDKDEAMEEVSSGDEEEEDDEEDEEDDDQGEDDEELDSGEDEEENKGVGSEMNKKKSKDQTVKKVHFALLFLCSIITVKTCISSGCLNVIKRLAFEKVK